MIGILSVVLIVIVILVLISFSRRSRIDDDEDDEERVGRLAGLIGTVIIVIVVVAVGYYLLSGTGLLDEDRRHHSSSPGRSSRYAPEYGPFGKFSRKPQAPRTMSQAEYASFQAQADPATQSQWQGYGPGTYQQQA